MGRNVLSQEEIDALLTGRQPETPTAIELSLSDQDALGEIGNISMGSAATTLSVLLNRRVQITIPRVSVTTLREIGQANPIPFIVVDVSYTEGLLGKNLLVVKTQDGAIIADLMMGGSGLVSDDTIGELQLSAVSEAMNQMMGTAATSLSTMFDRMVVISPPIAKVVELQAGEVDPVLDNADAVVKISFSMMVDDLIDSEIMLLLPASFAKEMLALLYGESRSSATISEPLASPSEPVRQPPREARPSAPPQESASTAVPVQPVQFAPLQSETGREEVSPRNLNLLLDIPLELRVELGRTSKTVKEVLELAPGSIFELDRVAGEPVDIFVNGKLIAKGEVVVIDENFGVRITDILSVIDRVSKLQ